MSHRPLTICEIATSTTCYYYRYLLDDLAMLSRAVRSCCERRHNVLELFRCSIGSVPLEAGYVVERVGHLR
jgi:hypothetical protein